MADAKQAGLWDQNPTVTKYGKTKANDSPWYRYPKRMLKARALGFAWEDGGADALKGMMYREEAEDMGRTAVESWVGGRRMNCLPTTRRL